MPERFRHLLTFVLRFAVLGLAAAFVLNTFAPALVARLRGSSPAAGGISARSSGPVSYAQAVAHASPAVVNIYANKVTTVRNPATYGVIDPLTQRLLGVVRAPPMQRRDQSLGSGVVFRSDGYVLTNHHVISGADDIQIMFDDGRIADARIIGTDAETDLAVIKVDAERLPTIDVADSASIEVGDVVLAIGNPVGLGKTVTMGIVSATGRQLHVSAYEDFIQTDAAINAGNSGGALVNALGELIGINTRVYSRMPTSDGRGSYTPGAEGIGFAIPVSTAKTVLEQILRNGRVIRGWIGADYVDASPAPGTTTRPSGVQVLRVVSESPAALAGLRPGDLILKAGSNVIADATDLRNREAALTPGTPVEISGVRGDQPFTVTLVLAERPAPSTTGA